MKWTSALARRDPGLQAVRRAVRVAAAACIGFYACRYGLQDPVMATYALFGAVALGALSQIPGAAAERARTMVAVLPVVALLIFLGTALAGSTWAAIVGMLVVGFTVAFAGVGGPRLVGLAAALQLFYILPCFPPYAPATIGSRLVGVCVGILLLAITQLLVWPDRAPEGYESRLTRACSRLADFAQALFTPSVVLAQRSAQEAAEALRPSRLPPQLRPAGPGRRDRAYSQAAGALRFALGRLSELSRVLPAAGDPLLAQSQLTSGAEALLAQAIATARASAGYLTGGAAPDTDALAVALKTFERARREQGDDDAAALRGNTLVVELADGVWVLATAVRLAAGVPTAVADRTGRFWYAGERAPALWWRQLRAHLTPRSVHFQGAVRVALALATARLVAGVLDLQHGFWVLLATLTLMRSRAADTRTALVPVVIGTVVGALAAAILLLVVGPDIEVYAIALPPTMLLAFAVGALFGPAWGQAFYTLFIAMAFTQLAPASVQLAEARVVDVLTGAAVGVLAGIAAWPRGGGGELRRNTADFLASAGDTVGETVSVLAGSAPPHGALARGRQAMLLADASYAMYQAERPDPRLSTVDWQAAFVAGDHIVQGAEALLAQWPAGALAPWAEAVTGDARRVQGACGDLAAALREPGRSTPTGCEVTLSGIRAARVVDVEVWLGGVAHDVARVVLPLPKDYAPRKSSRETMC